jgi:hypothetical protein
MMTTLHDNTFEYLNPTDKQKQQMALARAAASSHAKVLEGLLPDGLDKDHALRLIRTAAMWANVSITRHHDGTPRSDDTARFDPGADAGAFASMDGKR